MNPKKVEETPLREQIDENLRKVYQQTLNEEVPDHLLSLLHRLREQDARDEP